MWTEKILGIVHVLQLYLMTSQREQQEKQRKGGVIRSSSAQRAAVRVPAEEAHKRTAQLCLLLLLLIRKGLEALGLLFRLVSIVLQKSACTVTKHGCPPKNEGEVRKHLKAALLLCAALRCVIS